MGASSCLMRQCVLCVKLFKWLPVILITAIVSWSYYAYVIQLCFFRVNNIAEQILYLLFYHISFVMFVWSYWQTIFTAPGEIPRSFYLTSEVIERLEKESSEQAQQLILEQAARNLPVLCRNFNGTVRYCEKCRLIKPDRAHHCSVCSQCVLKMDHHCPWVNNCVAFANYKYFVLFLGYAIIYCFFVAATTCQYFIIYWTNRHDEIVSGNPGGMTTEGWEKLHILFLFLLSIMFAISLVSLFCYHCYLVTLNRTTLESFRPPVFRMGPDKRGFYLGRLPNFRQVFGDNKRLWFMPLFTSLGNGIEFSTRRETMRAADDGELGGNGANLPPLQSLQGQATHDYNSMGETNMTVTAHNGPQPQLSMGDGVSFPQRTEDGDTAGLLSTQRKWTTDDESEIDDQELGFREVKVVSHHGVSSQDLKSVAGNDKM